VTARKLDEDSRFAAGARTLLSAGAVRDRAQRLLMLAEADALPDWRLDLDRLPATADVVAAVVRERYPALRIPFHARWRHFDIGGRDLWQELAAGAGWPSRAAAARAAFDLVIASVLLDAGAGSAWRFVDAATGSAVARSEGLGVASLRWFERGGLSARQDDPWRVDATMLGRLDRSALETAFQVSDANPLVGLDGRAALLNRLGQVVAARPDLFARADTPRPGGLFDVLAAQASAGRIGAAEILEVILDALGPIWEGRPRLGGVPLGDCWPHPALAGKRAEDTFVPLHKLSQWLTYSLIEPLEAAGFTVTDVDALTGLAEYRNGGLFVDMGVLNLREPQAAARAHAVSDPIIVAWRSLTVALLDRLAPLLRQRLGLSPAALPLARVLEGGTWAAGRVLALERRPGGGPPFQIISDGTVF
jgi:hypothetical protein